MMETYWNGKHRNLTNLLSEQIPAAGPVTDPSRPALEAWRQVQNAYYDYYNNGLANWEHYSRGALHAAIAFAGTIPFDHSDLIEGKPGTGGGFVQGGEKLMEDLADNIFGKAVIEHFERTIT